MSSNEEVTQVSDNNTENVVDQPPTGEMIEETSTETASQEVVPDEDLAAQLDAARKEAQENLEGRLRTLAEFQNYKRRVERELKESQQKAALDVLKELLPIIDDFERAMSSLPEDWANHSWLNGITLIQRNFQKILENHEVTVIDPVGEVFDPSRHEALGIDENAEVESGHVAVTLQKGYVCGDRVLRPALVRVAS